LAKKLLVIKTCFWLKIKKGESKLISNYLSIQVSWREKDTERRNRRKRKARGGLTERETEQARCGWSLPHFKKISASKLCFNTHTHSDSHTRIRIHAYTLTHREKKMNRQWTLLRPE